MTDGLMEAAMLIDSVRDTKQYEKERTVREVRKGERTNLGAAGDNIQLLEPLGGVA